MFYSYPPTLLNLYTRSVLKFPSLLFWLLTIIGSNANAHPSHVKLDVISSGEIRVPIQNNGLYKFEAVRLLDKTEVERTFCLRNDGNMPLTNLRLESANGCLKTFVTTSGNPSAGQQPFSSGAILPALAPGQEIAIRVLLNLASLPPGPVQKTVALYAPDSAQPIALLEMRGTLLPSVTFEPATLDFGRVPAGKLRAVILHLSLDPRLAPFGSVPQIVCTNPDINIQPLPLEPSQKRKSPLLTERMRSEGLYSYVVTLSEEASLGPVTGNLFVASVTPPADAAAKPTNALQQMHANAALRSASAFLSGQVEGDVTAAPQTVFFGTVDAGRQAVQRVVLTSKKVGALQNVKINSGCPWLSARLLSSENLLPIANARQSQEQTLEVILDAKTPAGRLQSQLILTLANGQRLVLPVGAVVAARKPHS